MEMRYYKIIQGDKFLGVATSSDLRKYFKKRNGTRILVSCLEDECQYIQLNDTLYHDNWMRKEDIREEHFIASIIEIIKEQYDFMNKNIDEVTKTENDEWTKTPEPVEDVVEEQTQEEIVTIEYVKEQKIKEMSAICQSKIFSGFDIVLSDRLSHHFSLSTQDQLNLITLSTTIMNGQPTPYHADGELCKFYSANDMQLIMNKAIEYKTYHTSYFNSLKAYINTLNDVNEVIDVRYGMDIPLVHQSEVMVTFTTGMSLI